MKPHNLKLIKKRLTSTKRRGIQKKFSFSWDVHTHARQGKVLNKNVRAIQDARQTAVIEYASSFNQIKMNGTQIPKSICLQPVAYSTPLKGCVSNYLPAEKLFDGPKYRPNNRECRVCPKREYRCTLVETSCHLQDLSGAIFELMSMTESQQMAVYQIMTWLANKMTSNESQLLSSSDEHLNYSFDTHSSLSEDSEMDCNESSFSSENSTQERPRIEEENYSSADLESSCYSTSSEKSLQLREISFFSESDGAIVDEYWYSSSSDSFGSSDNELGTPSNQSNDDDYISSSLKDSNTVGLGEQSISSYDSNLSLPDFPVSTMDDFAWLEFELKTNPEFKSHLVAYLSGLGGKYQRESTKTILRHSLAPEVAIQFSHQGIRTKKAAFNKTSFYSVFKEALRKRHPKVYNDNLVNSVVVNFLSNPTKKTA